MARSTQYIGLNKWAVNLIQSKEVILVKTIGITTGMFGEEVMGSEWHVSPPEGPNEKLILKEEVQMAPWSSGPMIFTHLKATLVKKSGQLIECGHYCSWIIDPTVEGEFDPETGRAYPIFSCHMEK